MPLQTTDAIVEGLTIDFSEVENNQTWLMIAWDDVKIEIPVTFTDS